MTTPRRLDRLVIDYAAVEGALLRILGLVERRGFDLRRVAMAEVADGRATLALEVSPREPGRRLATLQKQIERLHGIGRVAEDGRSDIQEEAA